MTLGASGADQPTSGALGEAHGSSSMLVDVQPFLVLGSSVFYIFVVGRQLCSKC